MAGGNETHYMDKDAAARIQAHADHAGKNKDFKARAQSTADRREHAKQSSGAGDQSGSKNDEK